MKLAVMQPYFFPYLGYFDLINSVDRFIFFDTAQYPRRGWVARNRVLHPRQDWQYICVPLHKAPRNTAIGDMQIFHENAWKDRIVNQLEHYRTSAPYFRLTMELVSSCLENDFQRIADLNVYTLRALSTALGLNAEFQSLSEQAQCADVEGDATSKLIQVCRWSGADHYVNLPGGTGLYDASQFAQQGIRLEFRHLPTLEYETPGYQFEPGLSIIDVLMWNTPETVKAYLDQHREMPRSPDGGGMA